METALMIHNLTEDLVKDEIDKVCAEIDSSGQDKEICTCPQCRLDAACYVLNRSKPYYIVSNRGVSHLEDDPIARKQEAVDTTVLVYKALRQVAHNQRPLFSHGEGKKQASGGNTRFVFNIPAIIGRLSNGVNFEPISGVDLELRHGERLAGMRDLNWPNPFSLVVNTNGNFTFWPAPIAANALNERASFEFSLYLKAAGFTTLNHVFDITVVSEEHSDIPFSMDRTFRLGDMYIFPETSSVLEDSFV